MGLNRKPIFDAVKEMRGGKPFSLVEIAALDAAIDEAAGLSSAPKQLADHAAFYKALRASFGPLEQGQVEGLEMLLGAFGEARWPISWAAYGLATAWHETNRTMQPVREAYWLSEDWRRAHLRYFPWYGRGYVQLTWQRNYENADHALGLNGGLVADPDCALRPDIAARICVWGMEGGAFTQKRLSDYLPLSGKAGFDAYKGARRIINGTDQNEKVAKEALVFEGALEAGGWA